MAVYGVGGSTMVEGDLDALTDFNINGFIPLAGTSVNSPVTGDIEFNEFVKLKAIVNNGDDEANVFFDEKGVEIQYKAIDGDNTVLSIGDGKIIVNSQSVTSEGIKGLQDFTGNITDLAYTQKKYVDNLLNYVGWSYTQDGPSGRVQLVMGPRGLADQFDTGMSALRIYSR